MDYVEELLPDLMLQAPDVSDTALRRALRLAAQDFFRESEVWLHELPPLMLFSSVERYHLPLPRYTRIARVDWVKLDGRDLDPLDHEDVRENRGAGYLVTNDQPHQFVITEHTNRGDVRVGARLYPTPELVDLPDWLVHDFRTPLVAATLARIYGAPGSPWFDLGLASQLAAQVESAMVRGKRITSNRKQGPRRTVRYGGY